MYMFILTDFYACVHVRMCICGYTSTSACQSAWPCDNLDLAAGRRQQEGSGGASCEGVQARHINDFRLDAFDEIS